MRQRIKRRGSRVTKPAPPLYLTFLTAFGFDDACLLRQRAQRRLWLLADPSASSTKLGNCGAFSELCFADLKEKRQHTDHSASSLTLSVIKCLSSVKYEVCVVVTIVALSLRPDA